MGAQLEAWVAAVDFEIFRADLDTALAYADGRKGGRPPYDPVLMFKTLIIEAQNNLSDARAEFLIGDRLSFMRFLGLGLQDKVADAKTIRAFRERLTRARAIDALFARFETALRDAGYIAMSGQSVDSTPVAAPKQRNTDKEKKDIKAGKAAAGIWPSDPAKARQKDIDARWTVQFGKAKTPVDGGPAPPDIAIPSFGYKNHADIDKAFRFIRRWDVTDAARHDGRMLRQGLLDKTNTGSGVRADSAYRSKQNEAFLARHGFVSHVHHRKPKGRLMPKHIRRGNRTKAKHRAPVENVFAGHKHMMGMAVRTIGPARAKTKSGMTNIACNIRRLVQLAGSVTARSQNVSVQ